MDERYRKETRLDKRLVSGRAAKANMDRTQAQYSAAPQKTLLGSTQAAPPSRHHHHHHSLVKPTSTGKSVGAKKKKN